MIKEFDAIDMDEVMKLWLHTNITAHHFIPENYWRSNYSIVKTQYMPMAKTFVYQDESVIKAFISILDGSFIGALFVATEYQGQGIGLTLINHCKTLYPKLELAVYVDNIGGVNFYKHCNFEIRFEQRNADSGFNEYLMCWCRNGEVRDENVNFLLKL